MNVLETLRRLWARWHPPHCDICWIGIVPGSELDPGVQVFERVLCKPCFERQHHGEMAERVAPLVRS